MAEDVLRPKQLVLPIVTTTVRDTLVAEVGTLVYDSDLAKLCICKTKAAAATSWEVVTSVEDS
jgi:hypothetical protein